MSTATATYTRYEMLRTFRSTQTCRSVYRRERDESLGARRRTQAGVSGV